MIWLRLLRAFAAICLGYALIIIIGIAAGLFPAHADICKQNSYPSHEDCATYNISLVILWHFGEWLNYYGGAITAIATAVIGYFTYTLWMSNRDQLQHAREVERAYISGGGARGISQLPDDPTLAKLPNTSRVAYPDGSSALLVPANIFEVHINNHGKTPARVHHIAIGFCDAAAPPPEPPYEPRTVHTDTFGPGTQSRRVTTVDIPQDRFARIAICGRFYWWDIWDRPWSSGFVYEIPSGPAHLNDSISVEAPPAYRDDREEPDDALPTRPAAT